MKDAEERDPLLVMRQLIIDNRYHGTFRWVYGCVGMHFNWNNNEPSEKERLRRRGLAYLGTEYVMLRRQVELWENAWNKPINDYLSYLEKREN